jgi:GTP-binding protein HflX
LELYGNTTGLSASAIKTLERIYRRKVPLTTIATGELVRSLCQASHETGRQVGALVHRSGQVDYVVVGDATRLMLPDIGRLRAAEGRFRGLRLVHTHLRGEPLTGDDIVDLVRLRLDMVVAIQLTAGSGDPRSVHYAYNAPTEPPYQKVGPSPLSALETDVGSLMSALEGEFAKRSRARAVQGKDGRAILVHVYQKGKQDGAEAEDSMRELRELARTAGVEVACCIIQGRPAIDPKYVMGKGKLNEIILRAAELDAQVLIFDRNLSPAQASSISKATDLKVIDRSQLILDIFAQRAESADGKLQVELAQLKYAMPRLQQKDDSLSRLTGGIGGRGPGETKLEIGRRRAKERIAHLEAQLRQLEKRREVRRRKRTRENVPTVAIVGYTNAGKSTLMNALTNAGVLAEDKLFATLDTRSRIVRAGFAGHGDREIVLTDTVGFIRNLPKDLFAAFRATFEEAADADLLLHVVDASDPAKEQQMRTTLGVLEELHLAEIPRITVFNKIDLLEPIELVVLRRAHQDAEFVSAMRRETTKPLLLRIAESLAERWTAAARTPELTVDPTGEAAFEQDPGLDNQATTLEEMLSAAGKRVKKRAMGPARAS